jgi:hypothetical protein
MTISLDQVTAKRLWARVEFTEIETELNEIGYTESDAATRTEMDGINQKIIAEIMAQFPEITLNQAPKYNKTFNLLEQKVPFYRFLTRWGLI